MVEENKDSRARSTGRFHFALFVLSRSLYTTLGPGLRSGLGDWYHHLKTEMFVLKENEIFDSDRAKLTASLMVSRKS